jgi:hypothetical protein
MFKSSLRCSKICAVAVVFLLVAVAILPAMAQTESVRTENQPDLSKYSRPYPVPKYMTMDELLALAPASAEERSITYERMIETIEQWTLPDEIVAQMSQEELNDLMCLPSNFTPTNQFDLKEEAPQGQQTRGTPQTVKVALIVDDNMLNIYKSTNPYAPFNECMQWAYECAYNITSKGNVILGGYDITFQIEHIAYWESPNNVGYVALLDAIQAVDPRGIGDSVLILMTGQSDLPIAGVANRGGRHFVMGVGIPNVPVDRLFAHEASHLYRCEDHSTGVCLMSKTSQLATDQYCGTCDGTMTTHKNRLDHYGVAQCKGSTTYSPGMVLNEGGIVGSIPDDDMAIIYGAGVGGGGNIVGRLDKAVSAHTVHVFIGPACATTVYVFVSSDNYNWNQISKQVVPFNQYMQWVNCGSYSGSFEYVAIAAICEGSYGACIYIDSVWVQSTV